MRPEAWTVRRWTAPYADFGVMDGRLTSPSVYRFGAMSSRRISAHPVTVSKLFAIYENGEAVPEDFRQRFVILMNAHEHLQATELALGIGAKLHGMTLAKDINVIYPRRQVVWFGKEDEPSDTALSVIIGMAEVKAMHDPDFLRLGTDMFGGTIYT